MFYVTIATGDHKVKSCESDLIVPLIAKNGDIFWFQISKTRRFVENEIINVTTDYLGEVFGGVGSPSKFFF